MTLRSLQFAIYTIIVISTVQVVGTWGRDKIESAGEGVGTRTSQLCQLDKSYCK